MRAFKFFALGFATALLLVVAAAFGFRAWVTTRIQADQAVWRRIPTSFVVQSDLGIAGLVKQGDYSHVGTEISEGNFPLARTDSHIASMGLFTPQQAMDTKSVIAAIAQREDGGPRAATMDECLQFGAYVDALKTRFLFASNRKVVCLGQTATINGACVVPQLWSVDYGRWNLGTTSCDGSWEAGTEFLVAYTRRPASFGPRR